MSEIYFHEETYCVEGVCNHFFYTWVAHDFSKIDRDITGSEFLIQDDIKCQFTVYHVLNCLRITMRSLCRTLTCDISLFTCTGELLVCQSVAKQSENTERVYVYNFLITGKEEVYNKLLAIPNDILVVRCRISISEEKKFAVRQGRPQPGHMNYLKKLATVLQNTPDEFQKQEVSLCVGDEKEIVNKAVLCSRSPVFAKMFQCDMLEMRDNIVKINDIKIHILRGLVSFLYTGIVPDGDANFLIDLYYTANKYDIPELRDECRQELTLKFTTESVCDALILSALYDDKSLKFSSMLFIASHLKLVMSTEGWHNLMHNEPKIALEIVNLS
ncbi:speckle-type POZ protein [Nephila pilipes]|uniref:Speckle-type POZ protein n=1 Tax=Nephila pilipes TaxID=299642 RepID=A0A8X6T8R1_NEPPI|nr:speckle-type POZ protein [Nephila pilipes]